MNRPILQAIGLSRFFGEFQALYPLDLQINPGEIVLLTGPNGAGKSTLLSCLSGILRPSAGNVLVEGYDLYHDEVSAKTRLAFVPDVPRFYQELTAWEHLRFVSLAFDIDRDWEARAKTLLIEFGLWDSRDLYPHNLSRGMRLKLGIAQVLIRPFKVLIMDEPTSALDLESVRVLATIMAELQANGMAIILSGHDLRALDTLNAIRWQMDRGRLLET